MRWEVWKRWSKAVRLREDIYVRRDGEWPRVKMEEVKEERKTNVMKSVDQMECDKGK